MDRNENLSPAEWVIAGEPCQIVLEERSPTARESARVFRLLREMVGDSDAEVRGYRVFLQSRAAAGNTLARDVLALLEPWWSETPEPVAAVGPHVTRMRIAHAAR